MLDEENTEELDATVTTAGVLLGLATNCDVPRSTRGHYPESKLTETLTKTKVDEGEVVRDDLGLVLLVLHQEVSFIIIVKKPIDTEKNKKAVIEEEDYSEK